LITGAVLVGPVPFVLIGLGVGSSHLLSVTRQRVMEVPPNELAKQTCAQARAAVAAGTVAWQNGIPATVS